MEIEELYNNVVECCTKWDLYNQSDAITQQLKACSEVGEACDNVNIADYVALRDDIGDMLVCVINVCQFRARSFILLYNDANINNLPEEMANPKKVMLKIANEMAHPAFHAPLIVTLIKHLAHLAGVCPVECLEEAYNVIKKRKGVFVNGTFVKDVN
jgi:hypothetical protein